MRQNILIAAIVFFLVSGMTYAAAPPLASNYTLGFVTDWLPIIFLGILAAISITVMYYFIGVILNNPRIKGTAISEIQQVLGTVLLVVIILAVMSLIGAGTTLSYTGGLGSASTNQIASICNNILIHSQVGFLNSRSTSANYPGPYPNLPQPTNAVCAIVNGHGSVDPATTNIDYGLAASYVVIANLTNQSIVELNGLYNIDSLIFFLRQLITYADVCQPVTCIAAPIPREQEVVVYYKLYSGYVFQRTVLPVMDTQANLSIYLYMSQLVVILVLLSTWPYLLAAGVLLRTFTITRRAGGLIIAAVIVGTIIYPILFLFQYSALTNLIPPGGTSASPTALPSLGASQIAYAPLCGIDMNTPTLSAYTSGEPTTKFQLWCITSAPYLQINYVYKGTEPQGPQGAPAQLNCDVSGPCPAPPATQANCASQGPYSPALLANIICACPAGGNSGLFSPPAPDYQIPTQMVAPCYVQKNINFYVFPSTADVIRLYTCYPPDYGSPNHPASDGTHTPYGIIDVEVRIVNSLNAQSPVTILLTLSNIVSNLLPDSTPQSGLSSVSPTAPLGQLACSINPQSMYGALTQLINLYGVISVTGFILPIINILILLSATFGISSLLGGETSIIGLSRFI